MLYINLKNDGLLIYPYSIEQLKIDNYNTSFTDTIDTDYDLLQEYSVYKVNLTQPPTYDTINQKIIEITPILNPTDNSWYQNWEVVEKTPEEVVISIADAKRNLQNAVQNRLDSFAQTRNYNSMLSCCSYATSTNTKFQQEAQYCVQMRDAYWSACYSILQQFESGQRSMPTIEQLLGELLVLQWPN